MNWRVEAAVVLCLLAAAALAEAVPDPELLEFLGEWETPDGAWLDPEALGEETVETGGQASQGYDDE